MTKHAITAAMNALSHVSRCDLYVMGLRLSFRKYAHPVCLCPGDPSAASDRDLCLRTHLSGHRFVPLPIRLGRTVLELIPLKVGDVRPLHPMNAPSCVFRCDIIWAY